MPVIDVAGDARRGPYRRRTPGNALDRGEHGTVAAYSRGCRCRQCLDARNEYGRAWRAAAAYGSHREPRWKVPNGAAHRHIAQLRRQGLTLAVIASRAGVSAPTVERIARLPRARCWNTVADAVVAVEP